MAFSESVKHEVKVNSDFSCCICHEKDVHIHHIIPQAEGGPDTIENAAPLCPNCHDRFGGNPLKRKFIGETRDYWYEVCLKKYSASKMDLTEILKDYIKKEDVLKLIQSEIQTQDGSNKNNLSFLAKLRLKLNTRSSNLTKAKLSINNKNYEEAKHFLRLELEVNHSNFETWFYLGYLYGEEGNVTQMVECFNKSLTLNSTFELKIEEYKKYFWQTTFNKGVSLFNRAVKNSNVNSALELFTQAIEEFTNSTLCEQDSTMGYENIAACYLNMGKVDESIPVLEKLVSIGKPSFSFARLGQIFLMKGSSSMDSFYATKNAADSTKALEWYNKAITVLEKGRAKYPSDTEILLQLGNAYYSSNKLDVALESFKTLSEKNPEKKEIKYAYGVVLLKSKKYEQATLVLTEVVKIDPNNLDANYNLAAAYIQWGNDLREEAIKKESGDKAYLEKFKATIPYLQKYLEVKPGESRVWLSLGQVYANLGVNDKVEEAFKKSEQYE